MSNWEKIPHAPYYLEIRKGTYKTSYRVYFRGEGLDLRDVLEGDFKTWKDALRRADELIAEARFGKKATPKELVRCDVLCDEVVALKQSKAKATYAQAELFFRLHIKPFLNEHCPYASQLNATVWLTYKNHLRLKNPEVALFNHWKFFSELCKHAFAKGLLEHRLKLEYNEKREDNRARGMIISPDHYERIWEGARVAWGRRILIQWNTGMRPGEVRELRKDRWDLASRTISLRKEDTKTRQARAFRVSDQVAAILEAQATLHPESPFFFPSEADPAKPMDKHLNGWRAAIRKANQRIAQENAEAARAGGAARPLIPTDYTPHDLRHSYLTRMFKVAANPALICYQAGLSLEEAQKTYLHFTAADTLKLAELSATPENVGHKPGTNSQEGDHV